MALNVGISHLYKSIYDHAVRDNALSNDEIKLLIETVETNLEPIKATVGANVVYEGIRKSDIRWIHYNQKSAVLFNRMAMIADQMNHQYFGFDLLGFDAFQYSEYHGGGGHYSVHTDMHFGNNAAPNGFFYRKLSFSLLLSDTSEFDGGEIQIQTGNNMVSIPQQKGRLIAFPSYILHRVTPVTSGTRKSLVFWVEGPRFK